MFTVYALTHVPSGYMYVGVAKHDGEAAELFLVHPFTLLKAATTVEEGDVFSLKVLDHRPNLEDADGIAQALMVRLREMEGIKLLNPEPVVEDLDALPAHRSMRAKAKAADLKYTTVMNRMRRGWTEAQALGQEPPPPRTPRTGTPRRLIEIGGETKPYSQWCKENGISIETALARERMGWSVERAVTQAVKERR